MGKLTVPLSALSPSVARLLLALVAVREHEKMYDIIMRSGIRTWKTYLLAKQQLLDGGYLFVANGDTIATLTPNR